ncbi:MAG: hypothetical protein JWM57_2366 [Phycisphaerales bacterium]|nr:hypothetical protein [Phycisphaerales bacterium]
MSFQSHPARGLIAAIAFATLAPIYARAADIDIYGTQAAAVEIPSIYGTVVPAGGANPGAEDAFQAYLDTGTSGIILSAEDTDARNIQAQVVNGQTVTFGDISVGGTVLYNVSEPVDVRLGRYTGESFETGLPPDPVAYFNQTSSNVRMQLSTEAVDPFGFTPPLNLVGMPALKNKVMVVDARLYNHLTGIDENTFEVQYDSAVTSLKDFPTDSLSVPFPQLQTWVYNKGEPAGPHANSPLFDPGVPTGQHVVRMSYGDFSGYTQLSPANAIAPTLAHNPFVGPKPFTTPGAGDPPPLTLKRLSGATQKTANGSWLFDTGAQISFMSSAMALSLGVQLSFDPTTGDPILTDLATGLAPEGQFEVALGGAGGDAGTLLGFRVGELDIPTLDGYIRLHDIQIGVLDITVTDALGHEFTIDGDLGMNTLLPTMDVAAGNITSSQFDFLTFDEQTGLLTLTDSTAVPEPATLAMIGLGVPVLLRRRRV